MPKSLGDAYVIACHPLSLSGSPHDACLDHEGKSTTDRDKWALFYSFAAASEWAESKNIELNESHPYITRAKVYPRQQYVMVL